MNMRTMPHDDLKELVGGSYPTPAAHNDLLRYVAKGFSKSSVSDMQNIPTELERPSLFLGFTAGTLDPRITFTRGSSGTYFGSDGLLQTAADNIPRFEYDPTTLAPKGLLLEEGRTNFCRYNRDLTQVARWASVNITATKTATGIDGVANSASALTATANGAVVFQFVQGSTASTTRITSMYMKRLVGSGTIQISQNGGATLTTVTPTSSWTRVELPSATIASPILLIGIATSGDSIAVDYVQHETAAFSTSPISCPADADVARAADSASMTGTAYSDWFGASTQGTFFVACESTATGSIASRMFELLGSGVIATYARYSATGMAWASPGDNAFVTVASGRTGQKRFAGAFEDENWGLAVGGTLTADSVVGTATASTAATDSMNIGKPVSGTIGWLNGTISRIIFWPKRLPDATLQALTA